MFYICNPKQKEKDMLKQSVTYTPDFSDEEVTKELYFNLRLSTLQQMITMEGWDKKLDWAGSKFDIDNLDDRKKMQEFWDQLIHRAYGIREGDEFLQSEEISDKFMRSAEYDALITDILYTENSRLASRFITGLFPKKIIDQIQKEGGDSAIEKQLDELERQQKDSQ